MLYRTTLFGVPPLHKSQNIALYTIFPKQRVKTPVVIVNFVYIDILGRTQGLWSLFGNCLQTSVKLWSREPYFLASRAERRKWKWRWLRRLTPRLTPWLSRCVFFSAHSPHLAPLTLHHQALTTKILNLVQQAANYKQLRKVIHIFHCVKIRVFSLLFYMTNKISHY